MAEKKPFERRKITRAYPPDAGAEVIDEVVFHRSAV
jgi:hypothetical protein